MTATAERATSANWSEPDGVAPRGTLIVIPGRGEGPGLYERFGRRIAGDAYRVHAVADPVADPALTTSQVLDITAEVRPYVLVGSDTGALFAAGLVASGQVTGVDAVVLAGLPTASEPAAGPGTESWEAELAARTACPAHRGRLAGQGLRRGALYEPVPAGWEALADLGRLAVPALGLHGTADPVSPLDAARERYRQAPRAELFGIAGGVHDVLNDVTHRHPATVRENQDLYLERPVTPPDRPTRPTPWRPPHRQA
jgi:pimeloyl-ACP methyl ester carboxylesterase